MTVEIHVVAHSLLAAMLLAATVTDLRSCRIPNLVSLGGLLVALVLAGAGWGAVPLGSALTGAAIGFGMLIPFYALKAMGAGDVKLMTATGAFLGGPALTLGAVAGTFVAGGVLGLAYMVAHRGGRATAKRYATDIQVGLMGGGWRGLVAADPARGPQRFPYAAAILTGGLTAILLADFWHAMWGG